MNQILSTDNKRKSKKGQVILFDEKAELEKNHEYIRYILPKGTSFASLSQNDCYLMASHINSIPRLSLNNVSPFEEAYNFIGQSNMDKLHIKKIEYDDINLTIRLLKK